MAKHRGQKIAGVSIANPRRIVKKVARVRAFASLHCSDGLKDDSMKISRSFADSTIFTYFLSVNVRGAIGGCPMGRWQHLSGLKGRSHFTDQSQALRRLSSCCHTAIVGKLSQCHQRTVEFFPPADLYSDRLWYRSVRF